MPLYEYFCPQCDRSFELLIRTSSEEPACPQCKSMEVRREFSVPAAAQVAGQGRSPFPTAESPMAGGCGRTACQMGGCQGLG